MAQKLEKLLIVLNEMSAKVIDLSFYESTSAKSIMIIYTLYENENICNRNKRIII